jgi:Flp pilus assembly protein TadG
MFCASLVRHARAATSGLARSTDGNVAVIFAIAIMPILTFIGAAIDYSRANAARSAMQAALDSVALMVAKDLNSGLITQDQIDAKAQAYFTGLYTNRDAQGATVSATYTAGSGPSGSTILVTGTGSISTDFLKVAGLPTINFGANATSTWGASLLRVALVLDNTGSMAQSGKITALRTAAAALVDQLSALAQNSGDVMMSVIPFNIDVNVGTGNVGASWLRWDVWDPKNANSFGNTYCSSGNNLYQPTMAQCIGHGYTWNHTPNISDKSPWTGCVSDRDQSYDVSSDAPAGTSTYFVAEQYYGCTSVALQPLTTDWTTLKSNINAMTANGATNQTIGLQWGWFSLMQQSPLNAPAESSNNVYQHIIILFTDGLNTEDRWYGNGVDTSTDVDTRMTTLCNAIKAVNDPKTSKPMYTIYTVQIDTDGAGQSPVLPACASSQSNFYMLTAASQIASAFSQIGTQISKLRVAR